MEIGESSSSFSDPYQPVADANDSMDLVITDSENVPPVNTPPPNVSNNDVLIKHEVASSETRKTPKNVKFTAEEDRFLNEGIKKYGKNSWALILKDKSFQFHESRSRDSLRVRAGSVAFRKLQCG